MDDFCGHLLKIWLEACVCLGWRGTRKRGVYARARFTMKGSELTLAVTKNAPVETIVEILTKTPAAVKSVNKFTKRCALHWACIYDSPLGVVQLLVDKYPEAIRQADKASMTPLHHACSKRTVSLELIRLLVQCSPEAAKLTDECGNTPLHLSCEHKIGIGIIHLLLSLYPVAVVLKNDDGLTARDLARIVDRSDWDDPWERKQVLDMLDYREQEELKKEEAKRQLIERERMKKEEEKRKEKEALEKERQAAAEKEKQEEEAERLQKEKDLRIKQTKKDGRIKSKPNTPDETLIVDPEEKGAQQKDGEVMKKKTEFERILHSSNLKLQRLGRTKVIEEEKKSERGEFVEEKEQEPRSLLRCRPSPDRGVERAKPVALMPRLEPPPGLDLEEKGENPLEDLIIHQNMNNNVELREVEDMFSKDESESSAFGKTTPVTPEPSDLSNGNSPSTKATSDTAYNIWDQRHSLLGSIIPDVMNVPRQSQQISALSFLDVAPNSTVVNKESRRELEDCSLFPDVNLQSLAVSMGYDHLLGEADNEDRMFKLRQDKCLENLQAELFTDSQESTRLMEEQQVKFRKSMSNNDQRTPLHLACAHDVPCLETIQLLIDTWPSSTGKQDKNGRTPLHIACAHKAPQKIIRLLVEKNVSVVSMRDKVGNTPLHIACEQKCSYAVIRILLENHPSGDHLDSKAT